MREAKKLGASKYWGPLSCIRVRQFCEQHERRAMGEKDPSPYVGGAGRRSRWDCQRGSAERGGCGGGAYSVPASGWEAGPARRLTRGRSGKTSAWSQLETEPAQ